MKKVLVTGASGFLGRHLIKRLEEENYEISVSNTKLANLFDIKNLSIYDHIKFDYIFHLASKTKAGDWCKYHKGEQWLDNQKINTNILEYWYTKQSQAKLVSFGTSCSYGPSDHPLVEDDYMKYEPDEDLYTYAMTKRMLLIGCQSIAHQFGLKYLHFIPSTLFGENFDKEDSHFIFDLIKKIVKGKRDNEEVELWGDGNQKRELVYIKDAIDIILNCLNLENEIINIGSERDYSIREYAKLLCDKIGYDESKIKYNQNKFIGVRRKLLSVSKLNSHLSTKYMLTDLKASLDSTVDYYINLN